MTAIPPPPENWGSKQHQCMFSFGGSRFAGGTGMPLCMFPPSSESEESSSCALSFMRFGDRVAPGAHQNRFPSTFSCRFRSSNDADDAETCPSAPPSVLVLPNARVAKWRIFARFRGIGLLKAQLAQSVFRQPMQCMRTLHDSHRSRMTSLHCAHLTSSMKAVWLLRSCTATCLPSPAESPSSGPSGSPSWPVSAISHNRPSCSPSFVVPSTGPIRLLDRHNRSNGTQTSMF
jgi:hypothetical protein